MCKQACDALNIDKEIFVLKVYNHFSCSAKRREELQSYFEFVDLEWQEVLRHVCTTWLSLKPAADRFLLNWDAAESYFKSTEEYPVFLRKISDDKKAIQQAKLYFLFFSNASIVFEKCINSYKKKIECIRGI
jgi:hypothetical protein